MTPKRSGSFATEAEAREWLAGQGLEPQVRPTRYEVSVLPEDDINYPFYALGVEDRGNGRWAVVRHRQCLGVDGEWSWESIPSERDDGWLAALRFDLDTALDLARKAAPGVVVNGIAAVEVLRRSRAGA